MTINVVDVPSTTAAYQYVTTTAVAVPNPSLVFTSQLSATILLRSSVCVDVLLSESV